MNKFIKRDFDPGVSSWLFLVGLGTVICCFIWPNQAHSGIAEGLQYGLAVAVLFYFGRVYAGYAKRKREKKLSRSSIDGEIADDGGLSSWERRYDRHERNVSDKENKLRDNIYKFQIGEYSTYWILLLLTLTGCFIQPNLSSPVIIGAGLLGGMIYYSLRCIEEMIWKKRYMERERLKIVKIFPKVAENSAIYVEAEDKNRYFLLMPIWGNDSESANIPPSEGIEIDNSVEALTKKESEEVKFISGYARRWVFYIPNSDLEAVQNIYYNSSNK